MIRKNSKAIIRRELLIKLEDSMELFVELFDSNKENTLLIIHGGPGESCVSFSYFAVLLSKYINVVMLDQRGVMRSKAEYRSELLNVNQLIEDFEEVRKKLQIKNWYILGHSFGGYIAMRYVLLHPQYVRGVIYENPCFNIEHSLCSIIENYIKYYNDIGETEKKRKIEKLLCLEDIVDKFDGIISLPDIDRKRVFGSEAITSKCREYFDQSLITSEAISKCLQYYNVIKYDKSLCEEYLSRLRSVESPALLIQGEKDPMLPVVDKEIWLSNQRFSEVCVNGTGHYVHSDDPETMVDIVVRFVCDNTIDEV